MSEFHFNFLERVVLVVVPSIPLNAPVPVLCMTSLIIERIQIAIVAEVVPPASVTSSRAVGNIVFVVIAI